MHPEPDLGIVIAAWPDAAGLAECLAALRPQLDPAVAVSVVTAADPPGDLKSSFPWVGWLPTDPDRLIPELWGMGMVRSRARVIAITTAHFTPAPDWVAAIRQTHARLDAPAIGGRIDPPSGKGPVAWATYFLRYSPYLRYRTE